jgi:hypothetical protein
LKAVQRAAKQQQLSATRFLKCAALHVARQGGFADSRTVGEVRQLLVHHYSKLEEFAETASLSGSQRGELLHGARQFQIAVLKALGIHVEA